MSRPLRVGTRRSRLALAQSHQVAAEIEATLGHRVELVEITTRGDLDPAPLATMGGTGVFVSALRMALLEGRVDLAVHSFKDLPTAPAEGLVVAAVPPRADPRDALVGPRPVAALPPGSRIGTGSPRRAAVLRSLGLLPVPLRGNVDTRLDRVRASELDGVVLAVAGLTRLGETDMPVHPLDPEVMVPAPGQGALAVETAADTTLAADLAALDHEPTRAAVDTERAALAALEAGCSAPFGALARVHDESLHVAGRVWAPDGSHLVSGHADGLLSAADALGHDLAATLLHQGAADLIPSPRTKETAL